MNNEILIRFFKHQCTPEEIRLIDEWLTSDSENVSYFSGMERIWEAKNRISFSDKQQIDAAYLRLTANKHKKKNRKYGFFFRYAAVFAVLIISSLYLYWTLSGQKPSGYNLIEVPRGELISITLSDGTRVWLNSDTRFSYPDRFGSRNREVTLEGEGFFEVSTDKKKPFIVKGERVNIRVLGTSFNVRAHKNEEAEISLKTGKLEVTALNDQEDKIIMSPNQQIRYSPDGTMHLSSLDMSSVDSWRHGGVSFISQPLSTIIKTLERKYKVIITLQDGELADEIFNCRARTGATLPQVLTLLQDTRRLTYTMENDNHIIITKNELPMEK